MTNQHFDDRSGRAHGGHSWLMIVCCIPMLAIAVALVVSGAASPGFVFVAIGCTVMMALMMRMDHSDDETSEHRSHSDDETPRGSSHTGHDRPGIR